MRMRTLVRPVAIAGSLLVALTTVAGPATAAPSSADRGADWLAGQLQHGLLHTGNFADPGLTIDGAFALDEIGGHRRALHRMTRAVARDIEQYTGQGAESYAGATAKAAVLAKETGRDPRSFGGADLIADLKGLVQPSGRIADDSQYGDYANVIGQAYAVAALAGTRGPQGRRATAFLLDQQCGRGFFRLNFSDPASADQSCAGAPRALRSPDTDVTAIAVLMLQTIEHPGRHARRAIAHGVRWLTRHQHRDGSFGGGTSTAGSNTNSTGLAARALGEAGACRPARKAATWVADLQVTRRTAGRHLRKDLGAIAYDRAAFRQGRRHGLDDATLGQWRRATSQAAPALTYLRASACRR